MSIKPGGLTHDGEMLWTVNTEDNSIVSLREDGTVTGIYKAGKQPSALLFWRDHLWVADRESGTVIQMSKSGEIIATVPVGQGPMALEGDADSLWVANSGDGTVAKISPAGQLLGSAPVGSQPGALLVLPGGVWVATRGAESVAKVDAVTLEVTRYEARSSPSPAYGSSDTPGPGAIAFDGKSLWLGFSRVGVATRVGLNGHTEIYYPLGPDEITGLTANGGVVWASHPHHRLTRITGDIRELLRVDVGGRPTGLASEGQSLWVVTQEPSGLTRIDP